MLCYGTFFGCNCNVKKMFQDSCNIAVVYVMLWHLFWGNCDVKNVLKFLLYCGCLCYLIAPFLSNFDVKNLRLFTLLIHFPQETQVCFGDLKLRCRSATTEEEQQPTNRNPQLKQYV